jgi:O-methyltransferase involved in polyketide biosynthesis
MAESLGYFKDPYCSLLSKQRRKMYPVINRGTWARVHSIRQVILRFVNKFKDCNIISLGAGFDSTFWWLKALGLDSKVCYVEIDYPDVITKKLDAIKAKPLLKEMIVEGCLKSD